jgi:hypothetical protein
LQIIKDDALPAAIFPHGEKGGERSLQGGEKRLDFPFPLLFRIEKN